MSEQQTRTSTVGVVGLGKMGAPMAANLARAGLGLTVYDTAAPVVASVSASTGAAAAPSLRSLGQAAGTVLLSLPNGEVVRQVVLGVGGGDCLVDGMSPGDMIVDLSSSAPADTRRLGEALAERGIGLVDAPVSGGVARAENASLAIFLGGTDDAVGAVRPLLEHLGSHVFHAGPLGAGHAVKALNNLLSATGFAATIEVLRAVEAYGVDPQVFTDIVNASSGSNNTTQNKLRQFVLSETFASGFALDLMVKDLRIARDLAAAHGVDLPLCARAVELWERADEALGSGADHTQYATVALTVGDKAVAPAG